MASSTLFFFLCAAIMHLSLTTTTAQPIFKHHYCDDNGYYSANSGFAVNLNLTLSSLIANAATSSNGFYNLSIGQSPADRVYGLFQCRGDISPGLCHTCIQASSENILGLCPYKKEGIIWYDICMLRYANWSIFGIMEANRTVSFQSDEKITVDGDEFNATLSSLMEGLITTAVSGSSKMFATGDKALSIGPILYGLVQCTSDISQPDCKKCLSHAVANITRPMVNMITNDTHIGRTVLLASCNARYERYLFYDDSVAAAAAAAAQAPPPATNSSPSLPYAPISTNSPGIYQTMT